MGRTPLFEIIYPENRIVVDYGALDDLRFLGSVDIETGEFLPSDLLRIDAKTLRDVVALPDRPNAEGLVVWTDSRTAIKFKQQDYVELHRIVSSLSQKEVWRQLSAGTYHDFVVKLPDEFYKWADTVAIALIDRLTAIDNVAHDYYNELKLKALETRKEQAMWIQENVDSRVKALVFLLLDGRDTHPAIWKMVEPIGANPMKVIVE